MKSLAECAKTLNREVQTIDVRGHKIAALRSRRQVLQHRPLVTIQVCLTKRPGQEFIRLHRARLIAPIPVCVQLRLRSLSVHNTCREARYCIIHVLSREFTLNSSEYVSNGHFGTQKRRRNGAVAGSTVSATPRAVMYKAQTTLTVNGGRRCLRAISQNCGI